MAHGNQESTNAYFVKLLGLKEKEPKFEVTHKVDGEYKKETASYIEGNFINIIADSYEWEGKQRPIFKITLDDNGDKYILNFSYTTLSRGLLNSLCGLKEIGKLRIEVRGYIKDGQPKNAMKVLNDGIKAEWAMSYEDTKLLVETVNNSKGEYVSTDTTALDKFYTDKFIEMNTKAKQLPVVKETILEDLPF